MFCQLEMLRNCLPQNVRRILRELPASLDETYERMLRELMKVNPDQVYRLLQCITVSIRPIRVEELAEILALDFDLAEEGIPALNEGWRSDDEEHSVLSICSSLIVVVDSEYRDYPRPYLVKTRVVQFAHFSVKEFLTSDRLASTKADISRFHIRLEPAHTLMTQACLAILLRSDRDDGAINTSPLSDYASRNWVGHAQVENVSLCVEDGMRRLFDPAKPYFGALLDLHNLDSKWESFLHVEGTLRRAPPLFPPRFTLLNKVDAPLCLYYAALCGFCDLTKHFIAMYPQHVNASVGLNLSPLVAALRNRHIQVAELLLQHGALLPIGCEGRTLLHASSADGLVDVTQWLLNIGLDANAQEDNHKTPLHSAAARGLLEIVRILLGHGAYVNAVEVTHNYTALHEASSGGHVDVVRLLIENKADVHARDQSQSTPLHLASFKNNAETAQQLIKLGADVHARGQSQSTPLHLASSGRAAETVQILIKHGADVHAQDQSQSTPLHVASSKGNAETVQLLIEHGADVDARDQSQSAPLHLASSCGNSGTVQLLIKHGADVHARDQSQSTPLHLASFKGNAETVQLLIKHGVDVHVRDQSQSTPLHLALSKGDADTVQLLIEHGADVYAKDQSQSTPLHLASSRGDADTVQLLIKHGADVHAQDQDKSTPLHLASSNGYAETVRVLTEHGADVHARDESQSTPLHMASSSPSWRNGERTVRLLIDHGATVNVYDKTHETPLHRLSSCRDPIAHSLSLLLENGANVDVEDDEGFTPYQIALAEEHYKIARLLLDHRSRIVSNTR